MTEINQIEAEIFQRKVIDNRRLSMTDTVKYLISDSGTQTLRLAVGYFYISGLILIKDEFLQFMNERNGRVQIMMGNQTNRETVNVLDVRTSKEYRDELPHLISVDLDEILSEESFIKQVRQWISEGRIEIKVYTGEANYFHAKSYLFSRSYESSQGKAIVGSSNFSKNGLEGNTELNVLGQDNYFALNEWYSELWESDEVDNFSSELIEIVKSKFPTWKKGRPYKSTWETYYDFAQVYGKPYAEFDEDTDWSKFLYPHQKTGIVDVWDKLNTFGTAVLSDGVGLGKTRTVAGIVKLSLERQANLKTLIIADKKLKVQWTEELAILGISNSEFQYISREKLALSTGKDLERIAEFFDLIVVDEAHLGFKNRGTRAYRNLQLVDQHSQNLGKKIKGLMVTATPWNNSRKDVLNLGSLFLDIESIPSNRHYQQYFLFGNNQRVINKLVTDDIAFSEFWEDLFLQRTRKTYGGKNVNFASRQFPTVEIPYEPRKNKIFTDNFERISNLNFPYMDAIRYINPERNDMSGDRLKLMLLKRADSSWQSYLKSLEGIRKKNTILLNQLDSVANSSNPTSEFKMFLSRKYGLDEYLSKNVGLLTTDVDIDDFSDNSLLSQYQFDSALKKRRYYEKISKQIDDIKPKLARTTISKMKSDAISDDEILNSLINELQSSYEFIDEKFDKVKEKIVLELSRGRKVILISQFSDTAKYYYDKLLDENEISNENLGLITGNDDENRVGRYKETKKEILDRFSPLSKNRQDIFGTIKEINLLVGTDTISTGQNLQDAVVLMNLDLPYNPMVLEQRIGRIDRPRQDLTINEIYIYTFPVYEAIDVELKMSERLGKKMAGVVSDTEFDDIVLPEYTSYLEDAKSKKGEAIRSMLDETVEKTIFQSGLSSEKHSSEFKEANKRLYDLKMSKITRTENPVYNTYSFSGSSCDHSILVGRVYFNDVNGAPIESSDRIFDLDNFENSEIVNAERHLRLASSKTITSTVELSKEEAEILIDQHKERLNQYKTSLVEDYNNSVKTAETNFKGLQNKISESAALKISQSVRDAGSIPLIKSRLQATGLVPKDVKAIADFIRMIDEDSELYQYVKEIDADVDRFWHEFKDYAEVFDFSNLNSSIGVKVKRASNRQASIEKTEIEVLFGNIVVE
ncbi:helicase-related protein [Streptococcus salivarius]